MNNRSSLTRHRNQLRGAISFVARRGYNVSGKQNYSTAQRRYHNVLMAARTNISTKDYETLINWADNLSMSEAKRSFLSPSSLALMRLKYSHKELELEKEIYWVASRLSPYITKINEFLCFKDQYDEAVLLNKQETADSLSENIAELLGDSLWLCERKIAFEQAYRGIQAQKKAAEDMKKSAGPGLVSYLIQQASIRSEDSTRFSSYITNNTSRLNNQESIIPIKNYLFYRLRIKEPSTIHSYAEILRCEQSHSFIDLYETLVYVLNSLANSPNSIIKNININLIKKSDTTLKTIQDTRLDKAFSRIYGKHSESGQLPNNSLSRTPTESSAQPADLFNNIISHACRLEEHEDDDISSMTLSIERRLIFYIREIIRRNNYRENVDNGLKLLAIFRDRDFSKLLINAIMQDTTRNESTSSSVARILGDDLRYHLSSNVNFLENKSFLTNALLDSLNSKDTKDPNKQWLTVLDNVRGKISRQEPVFTKDYLKNILSTPKWVRCLLLDLFSGNFSTYPLSEFIRGIVSERVSEDGIHDAIGVETIYSSLTWMDIPASEKAIDKAIFIDLLHNRCNVSRFETYKKFALREYLNEKNLSSISESFSNSINIEDPQKFRVFLKNICEPSTIDMEKGLSSSEEVIEERKRICEYILETFGYDEPIALEKHHIEDFLKLQQVHNFVDSNRVYVDAEGLSRWIKRSLRQDFDRFLALAEFLGKDTPSLDALVLELKRDPTSASVTDIDESDMQLFDLIEKIKNAFLFDPSFGLDGYLSRRVRHNTLHLLLRSSFEATQLITQRDSATKEYKSNGYWLGQLRSLSEQDQEAVDSAIKKFSYEFDKAIIDLTKSYLHVKSESHPKGLFKVQLNDAYFLALKSSALENRSLAMFSSQTINVFWTALKPSLDTAKIYVKSYLEDKITASFSEISSIVRKVLDRNPGNACLIDLGRKIQTSEHKVLENVDKAAAWFSHSRAEVPNIPQSIEDIISQVVRLLESGYRQNEPSIEIDMRCKGDVAFQNLLFVFDIIDDILANIVKHCGIDKGMRIAIKVSPGPNRRSISIYVYNNLSKRARDSIRESQLKLVKRNINSGRADEFVRKEGDSGFYKIAVSTYMEGKPNIDFGRSGDGFYIQVSLPVDGDIEALDCD